ncbi:MAG: hypothetical protein J0H34_08815 [Rhizobiales bacterium]|nr:hypothetical protein [Hyphomicrobiales bacterium]
MKTFTSKLAGLAVASAALWAGQATAADLSEGFAGNPELMRELMQAEIKPVNKARPIAMVRTDEGTSRGAEEALSEAAFVVVGKTSDGHTVKQAPGDKVLKAVRGEIETQHRDITPAADL